MKLEKSWYERYPCEWFVEWYIISFVRHAMDVLGNKVVVFVEDKKIMECPFCEKSMEKGWLYGNRGIVKKKEKPGSMTFGSSEERGCGRIVSYGRL
jgi:hypothetical protein